MNDNADRRQDQGGHARLLGRPFRANPAYELVLFDRLPADDQTRLQALKDDPDLYGMLRPRQGSGLRPKSVTRDAALLYLTLQQPGLLPAYVTSQTAEHPEDPVMQLLLDGVLEVECDGSFVSGTAAHALVYHETEEDDPGALARLSKQAVKYGAALELKSTAELSARLYFYNRLPASSHWRRRFPGRAEIEDHWGVSEGIAPGARRWEHANSDAQRSDWIAWSPSERPRNGASGGHVYKLYVSPHPDHARDALAETLVVLGAVESVGFKIGADLFGLLRPDKLVCYFGEPAALRQAAELLGPRLEGIPAQGVPFSGQLDDTGLLSWGIDPSAAQQAFGWLGRESWRLWVTNQLAACILAAKAEPRSHVPAWRFALDRVQLEGVDTTSWVPLEDVPPSFVGPGT